MNKLFTLVFLVIVSLSSHVKGQVSIDTVSLVAVEEINTQFCFNNTKLMAGKNVTERYLVYYNSDTIFLDVHQSGIWARKIAHTGSNIQSATLSFYKDTIWLCWKEGIISAQIKARFTYDAGSSWISVPPVSSIGKVAAPSIYASSNGKIHFVWFEESLTDTTVFHRVFYNGAYLGSSYQLSNPAGQGQWPSVIAIGDTVLCAWKEAPVPTKVWFRSSFNGGISWNPISSLPTTTLLSTSKDPNLAYAYDSTTNTHHVYLAYDGQNKVYLQRSMDFGNTWTTPEMISSINKASQFAHIECNNSGFVGIAYEQRPISSSLFDDTKKDVGFTYSTNWGSTGSFSADTLCYTHNSFGSTYPAFNKINERSFYLAWLTKDTVVNNMRVYERLINLNNATAIAPIADPRSTINIYPNPFSTEAVLQTNKVSRNATLMVYNFSGQIVQEIKNINGRVIHIYRNALTPGLYFIQLKEEQQITATGRIVVID